MTKDRCKRKRCHSFAWLNSHANLCFRHNCERVMSRFPVRIKKKIKRTFLRDAQTRETKAYLSLFEALWSKEKELGAPITVELPADLFERK